MKYIKNKVRFMEYRMICFNIFNESLEEENKVEKRKRSYIRELFGINREK